MSNQLTTTEEKKDIVSLLQHDTARNRIEPFLLPGTDYNRLIAGVAYATRQNGDLLTCTPASIIDAVARIQMWGLEIGVTAHLTPFNTKVSKYGEPDRWEKRCTAIADYKGIAELMVRSGAVRVVEARVVYSGDAFTYSYGLTPVLDHTPKFAAKERGVITHAYIVFRMPFNRDYFEVMPIEDIDAIRKKHSKQWASGPCPPWYAKKTVLRQAAKLMPKDPKLTNVLKVVEDDEAQEFSEAEINDLSNALDSGSEPLALPQPQPTGSAPLVATTPVYEAPIEDKKIDTPVAQESPKEVETPNKSDVPSCPECGSDMWDNRRFKKGPKSPDFGCKDRNCKGAIWPAKDETPINGDTIIPFGKEVKGKKISESSDEFLKWAVQEGRKFGPRTAEWQDAFMLELDRRSQSKNNTEDDDLPF